MDLSQDAVSAASRFVVQNLDDQLYLVVMRTEDSGMLSTRLIALPARSFICSVSSYKLQSVLAEDESTA